MQADRRKTERRPTVSLDRKLLPHVRKYTIPDAAPAGVLGRFALKWITALMDMAPRLSADEARALLEVAMEWKPEPRSERGEPRIAVELANFPQAILDEGTFVGLTAEMQQRIARRIAALDDLERLGLLLRLAWAYETMQIKPGPERRTLTFEEALRAARLIEDEP